MGQLDMLRKSHKGDKVRTVLLCACVWWKRSCFHLLVRRKRSIWSSTAASVKRRSWLTDWWRRRWSSLMNGASLFAKRCCPPATSCLLSVPSCWAVCPTPTPSGTCHEINVQHVLLHDCEVINYFRLRTSRAFWLWWNYFVCYWGL